MFLFRKDKKYLFIVFILVVFFTQKNFAIQQFSGPAGGNLPFGAESRPGKLNQQNRKTEIQTENDLNEKFFDISLSSGITYNTYQTFLSLGIKAGFFLSPLINTGIKIARELLYTYESIYEFAAVFRFHFYSKSAVIPFFHLESGYTIGKNLNGFSIRPGFGILYFVYKDFSIYLGALFDFWYFTKRSNSDKQNLSYDEIKLNKTNYDLRIIFGLTFILDS